jgi:AcrR family transcriptional regulator
MPAGSQTHSGAPKTAKQRDRADRVLEAARHAFAEKPFHEVLMDDVARHASVGKGTIYRYFPDKESLYFAVIFDGIEELRRRIGSSLPTGDAQEKTVRDLIGTLVSFFRQNRFFFRLMSIEDSRFGGEDKPNRRRWHEERKKLIDAITQMLERARDTDALVVAHPRTDAHILMGMVRSVLRHNEEKLTVQQMSDEIARVYLCGMHRDDGR